MSNYKYYSLLSIYHVLKLNVRDLCLSHFILPL